MKAMQLGCSNWEVLALVDDKDNCPVLDFLKGQSGGSARNAAIKMNAILTKNVPDNGPELLFGTELCKNLRDDINEFRKNPSRGPKLRVLWFYDRTGLLTPKSAVVCTHGLLKAQRKTPATEIDNAVERRKEYLDAVKGGLVEVFDLKGARVR